MMRYITLSLSYPFFIAINKSNVMTKIIDSFKDFLIGFGISNNDFFKDFSLSMSVS